MLSILKRSASSAFRGGVSGFLAMILQVVLLMWLRTVVNFQYKYNAGIWEAFSILYEDGGIARFYRGASFALITGPISRFGDTAANEGIKDLLSGTNLSMSLITFCASIVAALWRIIITPLDTMKTTMQVSGLPGWNQLIGKVRKYGLFTLYNGALANWGATLVGHYPWFAVNNKLERSLPGFGSTPRSKLIRRAFIGFCSSVASDCISNGIRVVKTYKQTSDIPLTYLEAVNALMVESSAGGFSFLVRGLGLKIFSNGLSSILFSVFWKMIMEQFQKREMNKTSLSHDINLGNGDNSKSQ